MIENQPPNPSPDVINSVVDLLTPVSIGKAEARVQGVEDFFKEYDASIIQLSEHERNLQEQYRSKCYGMLPTELRHGALKQLDMGARILIPQFALVPVTFGLSEIVAPFGFSLYYNKKVSEQRPADLPKLQTSDWVLGTLGWMITGTVLNPLSVAGIRNYMKARSMLMEIKNDSGDKKQEAPLMENEKIETDEQKQTAVKQFNTRFKGRLEQFNEDEKLLHAQMKNKLGGLWPEDFKNGAIKQTALGLGVYGVSILAGATSFGLGSLAIDAGSSLAYEYARTKLDGMGDMKGLNAFDWIVGLPIPGFLNPILVGGIRNLLTAYNAFRWIEQKAKR